jgi:ATP/ADP translocase
MGMKVILLHPLVIFFTGLLAAVFPSFWVLGGYRTAEYALKNSTFRFGTERAFMALPDEARIETRPLIDVVGERMGDLAAAGLLQLLFVDNAHLPLRPALITVAVCSLLLLLVARTLAKRTDTLSQISASKVQIEQEISLQGLAKENSALV